MSIKVSHTVIGFDFGTQKIGVASGQSLTGGGAPLAALLCPHQQIPWPTIEALLKEWAPDTLVVGLPLNMDDSESGLSSRARRFARQLSGRFNIPAVMTDERLSTREARELLDQQTGGKAKRGPDPRVDSIAAALIVETYFREGGTTP